MIALASGERSPPFRPGEPRRKSYYFSCLPQVSTDRLKRLTEIFRETFNGLRLSALDAVDVVRRKECQIFGSNTVRELKAQLLDPFGLPVLLLIRASPPSVWIGCDLLEQLGLGDRKSTCRRIVLDSPPGAGESGSVGLIHIPAGPPS